MLWLSNCDGAVFNELETKKNSHKCPESCWVFDKMLPPSFPPNSHSFFAWWHHASGFFHRRCPRMSDVAKKGFEIIHTQTHTHTHFFDVHNRVPCEFIHHPTAIWTERKHISLLSSRIVVFWAFFLRSPWLLCLVLSSSLAQALISNLHPKNRKRIGRKKKGKEKKICVLFFCFSVWGKLWKWKLSSPKLGREEDKKRLKRKAKSFKRD